MWNLGKGDLFLQGVSLRKIRQLYACEKDVKAKLRLLCAVHRKQGKSIDEIAYLLDRHRRTIHGWLTRFQKKGLVAKNSVKQSGRKPMLTIRQREKLVEDLERGPPRNPGGLWTTKEVKDLLKRKYGVDFVNQHVWRMLTTLGFSLLRPRKRHYKRPSKEVIERFKKKLDGKRDITERKGLLWARKMKRPLDSSPSSSVVGRDEEAILS